MDLSALVPADIGRNVAMAICAIAFVSGTARGFSGFGSALIFMPLASSIADPRLVAALLLIIDFVAAAPLLPPSAIACNRAGREDTMASSDIANTPLRAISARIISASRQGNGSRSMVLPCT